MQFDGTGRIEKGNKNKPAKDDNNWIRKPRSLLSPISQIWTTKMQDGEGSNHLLHEKQQQAQRQPSYSPVKVSVSLLILQNRDLRLIYSWLPHIPSALIPLQKAIGSELCRQWQFSTSSAEPVTFGRD